MSGNNPDLSPGHQEQYDKTESSAEKRSLVEHEIKQFEFAITTAQSRIEIRKNRLQNPALTDQQRQEIENQIANINQAITDSNAEISRLKNDLTSI